MRLFVVNGKVPCAGKGVVLDKFSDYNCKCAALLYIVHLYYHREVYRQQICFSVLHINSFHRLFSISQTASARDSRHGLIRTPKTDSSLSQFNSEFTGRLAGVG